MTYELAIHPIDWLSKHAYDDAPRGTLASEFAQVRDYFNEYDASVSFAVGLLTVCVLGDQSAYRRDLLQQAIDRLCSAHIRARKAVL